MTAKETLAVLFAELAELEGHQYKSRAYKRACEVLTEMSEEEYESRNSFIDIYGIGRSINDKVHQFRQCGRITRLDELRLEVSDHLNATLYKVRKSFVTKRISYAQAVAYAKEVQRVLTLVGLDGTSTFVGSLRRKKALIADLDVVATCSQENFEEILTNLAELYPTISRGEYKASFMVDTINKIQLDIIHSTEDEYPFQVLYLTGSKEFNIRMRGAFRAKGYKLNQTGIYDSEGNLVKGNFKTEKDIFDFLGWDYVEPNLR